jgi:serine/threonine-protein kinase RsbW
MRDGAACGVRASAFHDDRLEMVLNNTLQAIEDGRQELLAFFERHDLHRRAINRIEVIFEELVSNTLRHGFAPGSGQSIHVQIAALPSAVELTLEDDGAPFDPFEAPLPAPLASLDGAPLGGLGRPLVTRLSLARRYERPRPGEREDAFSPTNRVTVRVSTDPEFPHKG